MKNLTLRDENNIKWAREEKIAFPDRDVEQQTMLNLADILEERVDELAKYKQVVEAVRNAPEPSNCNTLGYVAWHKEITELLANLDTGDTIEEVEYPEKAFVNSIKIHVSEDIDLGTLMLVFPLDYPAESMQQIIDGLKRGRKVGIVKNIGVNTKLIDTADSGERSE